MPSGLVSGGTLFLACRLLSSRCGGGEAPFLFSMIPSQELAHSLAPGMPAAGPEYLLDTYGL